jgi:peptidoglycan/xylan/chitin deacetylase (PgdA/CDA1 family)
MPATILFGVDVETASEDARGFAKYAAELFHDLECPVTWYLTGKTLEMFPDEFTRVAKDGCFIELQAHTYGHMLLKSVLMQVPEGRTVHGKTDWYYEPAGRFDEIDQDLRRCQKLFEDILGRRAVALTGPWGYYRGLGDRPDLLELVDRHGFRILRTFARDEHDANPVPIEWQPFFYRIQGYPSLLELMIHGYQDDFYWEALEGPGRDQSYLEHQKRLAERVAAEGLTWSLASHDHGCATREGFERKAAWFRGLIQHAKALGIRFMTATEYFGEVCGRQDN